MAKDLTTSAIDRQNVLNNTVALPRIQEALDVKLLEFEGRYVLTKQMVADYYNVDYRTISRYIENHQDELEHNGYFLCKGKSLKDFKLRFVQDIDVPKNTPQIGLFDFRSFLNIGMLLTESEKAAIIMHVAAGHIDEELLVRIIPPVIKGEDFSEELKIDIAHAMESGELFSD